ncbi:RhoGAP-domain-containing protein [Sistotremastrum niveocremeum HHB9708]|uniref:RhoGAP-domain-containing protein n=1 Tax=Sistotremastrum niveocremeum HHB9708 TaxID=1314777 RepID=A0A164VYH7_9AGAM|nr:RhoGAP-domain-containing protein [Sistotremastrum niveocremeum HHB9708]
MPDDVRGALAAWEYSDSPSSANPSNTSQQPPRLSTDTWKDGSTATVVEPTFDEAVLRALCELDCGVPLLLDRIKQNMVSCREASVFFKKRALLEDEYGRAMQKVSKTSSEVYSMNDGKAGSFVAAWQKSMKVHESIAESRIRFAQRLNEMSEELAQLAKEVDKNRKQTKDLASRYERSLLDAEQSMEKAKNRFDMTGEELERILVAKEGESIKDTGLQHTVKGNPSGKRAIGKAVAKGGLLLKGKNPANIQRQEDDVRARMSTASDTFRKAVLDTQAMRQEYFNFQLPRILRALKECSDEIDLGMQYHFTRYAFLYESIILGEGSTLSPVGTEEGLKATMDSIDNRGDFKTYMQNYTVAFNSGSVGAGTISGRILRREGPWEEGFLPPLPSHMPQSSSHSSASASTSQIPDKGRPTFGVDLTEQMARDNVEIPLVLTKCCEAIERWGLRSQGIYRISGTVLKVAKLKERLDRDIDAVDLDSEEWTSDINNIAGVTKLWLRELPEPLLTHQLHNGFVDAAKIDNDRLRQIRLHERVNELPDPNYATLKYLMGHLYRISREEESNQMSISNLSIVFGPTLFGTNGVGASSSGNMPASGMSDTTFQNRAIETILEHYTDIFVDESEAS